MVAGCSWLVTTSHEPRIPSCQSPPFPDSVACLGFSKGVGFFISSLIRKGDAIVLQEFSCEKGKRSNRTTSPGRADLYFRYKNNGYLVEAKSYFSSINANGSIDDSVSWAKEVLAQANRYARGSEIKSENIFSLCFEGIYISKNRKKDYWKYIEKWEEYNDDLKQLDFYCVIKASKSMPEKYYLYKKYLYPAVAIYGLFNKRTRD